MTTATGPNAATAPMAVSMIPLGASSVAVAVTNTPALSAASTRLPNGGQVTVTPVPATQAALQQWAALAAAVGTGGRKSASTDSGS
jgi:hypothetical protein